MMSKRTPTGWTSNAVLFAALLVIAMGTACIGCTSQNSSEVPQDIHSKECQAKITPIVLGPDTECFDLETGKFVSADQSKAWVKWAILAIRGDAAAKRKGTGFVTHGVRLNTGPTDQGRGYRQDPMPNLWQAQDPRDLPGFSRKIETEVIAAQPNFELPFVWAFETVNGTVGVLEWTKCEGYKVYLRYKILARGKSE